MPRRDLSKPVKVWFLDGHFAPLFLLLLLMPSMGMLAFTVGLASVMTIARRHGFGLGAILRRFKIMMTGPVKHIRPSSRHRIR